MRNCFWHSYQNILLRDSSDNYGSMEASQKLKTSNYFCRVWRWVRPESQPSATGVINAIWKKILKKND
ncbi:MAG: hypothetical protein SFW66_07610 [Gammaproteobacteria bacterium]|nr:hypothetical protein [Gammaproteobacteria bacterium]